MLNKNFLFIIISIFLSFIISKFYIKNIDKKFICTFLILSIVIFTIFYFLGYSNKEYFHGNVTILDDLSTELSYITDKNKDNVHVSEETNNIVEEENYHKENIVIHNKIHKEEKIILTESEPSKQYVIPDINKLLLSNPTPININISYNSQNSVNELDNIKSGEKEPIKNKVKENSGERCDKGRIFNNSDWIYGENAWTNNPDFYIPDKLKNSNPLKKISQPLNELLNKNKKSNNNVCPMMVNTPWSEYKSGDSEPEPYNL
jgi:hypothetical protein